MSVARRRTMRTAGAEYIAQYLFPQNNLGKDNGKNGLDASAYSGVTYSAPPSNMNLVGGCAYFNSVNSYIQIPHNSLLSFSSDFTIEMWCNMSSRSNIWKNIVSKAYYASSWTSPYVDYFIGQEINIANQIRAGLSTAAGSGTGMLRATAMGATWHHVVFAREGTATKLYIDGTLGASYIGDTVKIGTGSLFLGNMVNKNEGIVDSYLNNVRFYDKALSVTEILEHYNNEK